MNYLILAVDAALISNVAISYFLGLSPLPELWEKRKENMFSALALILVMTLSGLFCSLVWQNVLVPQGAEKLSTIVFAVIILLVSFIISLLLRKQTGASLGQWFSRSAVSSVVLGVVLITAQKGYGVLTSTFYAFFAALGYLFVVTMLAAIEERMEYNDVPGSFRGMPILLVTAGLMAVAFHGIEVLG